MAQGKPVPLPNAPSITISENIILQPPLSRRGHGPGILLAVPAELDSDSPGKSLDPMPLQKWAEEGYAVAKWKVGQNDSSDALQSSLQKAVEALAQLPECDKKDQFCSILYGVENTSLRATIGKHEKVVGVVVYGPAGDLGGKPFLSHTVESQATQQLNIDGESPSSFNYPSAKSINFVWPNHKDFNANTATVAHSRSLKFIKDRLAGPYFDLESIWDEHTYYEFDDRSVEKTMGTMVQEPYVNHVPTMTGGIGRNRLSHFYRHHFIFNNPEDTVLELISRTVGVDRVVDEFIYCFTHDKEIDWLVPGIPPTGKKVRVPFTAVVNIRGDRLYHEHIGWDQASVLIQLGLLPEWLPYPHALPDGRKPAPGKRFEYRVPAAGVETAAKLENKESIESNEMFAFKIREVDDV